MVNLTDLDRVYADYAARVARADREGWMREALVLNGGGRTRMTASGVGSVRRCLGAAVVSVGVRLQGSPAGHAANPAASRYLLDAVR